MWHRKYRLLLVIYGICLLVGVREFLVSRGDEPPGWFSEEGKELTEVIASVNPEEPDTDFLEGMQSLATGDLEGYERLLEAALEQQPKHNDMLLRFYAQYVIDSGADWVEINQALNRWRINHPFDVETINFYIDRGPRTDLEVIAMRDAIERIPWVSQVFLEPIEDVPDPRWRVVVAFRNAAVADYRDITRAVTLIRPNG